MSRRLHRIEAPFRKEFLAEAEGLLEQSHEAYGHLAGPHPSPGRLNELFRAVHSLKGLSAMTGFPAFSTFAHDLESLLDGARLGRLPLDAEVLTSVGEGIDTLQALAERIQAGDADPAPPEEARRRIRSVATRPPGQNREGAGPAPVLPDEVERTLTEYERHRLSEGLRLGRRAFFLTLDLPLESFEVALRKAMDEAARSGELVGTFPGLAADPSRMVFRLLLTLGPESEPGDLASRCGASAFEELASPKRLDEEAVAPSPPGIGAAQDTAPLAPGRPLGGTVRVPLEKLSHLLNLTGELAFARWALQRSLGPALDSATDRGARHDALKAFGDLDRTVAALGRAALATRLVPVEQLTARLSRVVATLAPGLGKEITFEVFGGETEVDKILAEELTDPLLHIVRNAVDHGIETPGERERLGKPRGGRVTLTVEAQGRSVVFTLSDDGRGMDPAALVRHARETRLLSPREPDPVDPFELIFRPSFSTANGVTELSGRGVGLDVVRANLAALKGTVRVSSVPGAGTTFEVEVPATLVLVESLLVRAEGRFFALPTAGIRHTFRIEAERLGDDGGHAVVTDEGAPLQVRSLARLLALTPTRAEAEEVVVVAEQGSRRAGLAVSAIEGMEDLIVKPLPDVIPRRREVTGAAELPGGNLALTLDPGLLVELALAEATLPGARP